MTKALSAPALLLLLAGCQQLSPTNEKDDHRHKTEKPAGLTPKIVTPEKIQAVELDGLISFVDPSLCELGPQGSRFMNGLLIASGESPIKLGRVDTDDRFSGGFGKPRLKIYHQNYPDGERTDKEAHVPVEATWHGLKLVEISSSLTENSDGWSYSFVFAEPFEKVRKILNRLGFRLSAKGEQPLGNSETAPNVAIDQNDGRTTLSCWF